MKISEILKKGITVSCELFPPKTGTELSKVNSLVADMAQLKPSFMSVTYGAAGGTKDTTASIADKIQNGNGVTALSHITCVTSDKNEIDGVLSELRSLGIENVLALRGDIPAGVEFPSPRHFFHASDLMKEIVNFGGFCIGGACYPEGHPEAESLDSDIENLKIKSDNGCEFFTSQMFFDNDIMYRYLDKLAAHGVNTPIIAGIMPVTNASQINRICSLSGTILPRRFHAIVERFGDNPAAMKQAGIAYATDQIIDLIASGVEHIHIYTMNKPDVAGGIMTNLSEIFKGN